MTLGRELTVIAAGLALAVTIVGTYRARYVRRDIRPPPSHYRTDAISQADPDAVALSLGWTEESRYTKVLREWCERRWQRILRLNNESVHPDQRSLAFNRQSQVDTAWLIGELGHPIAEQIVQRIPLLRIDPVTSRLYVADLFGNKLRDYP